MADARRAVVLLSCGMDSCVCAAIACKQHAVSSIALLHASYGQRTELREARAFREIADFYGIAQRLEVRPEYYQVFQELIRVGTRPETEIEIATPVIALKKREIIRRGMELGAPLHLTWSCYQNEEEACGACDSCLLRLRAFSEAGIADPISYRSTAGARQ